MLSQLFLISLNEMKQIIKPITEICSVLVPVMLTVVGSLGAIWVIILGCKYAKAEDPQEHEKAKNSLKNAIVGFVLIFVLLIMLNVGLDIFTNYYQQYINA